MADSPSGSRGRRVPANPTGSGRRPPAASPSTAAGRRVPATPRAQNGPTSKGAGKNRKPDSNVKKAANTAVRQGANSALTAATGGVAAPVVAAATSLIGNDAKAKKNRRRLLLALAAFVLTIAMVMSMIMATVFGVSIMGGGSGAAGTASPNNGNCLTYGAPRVTQPGGGSGGPGASAGALGAPLDPEYMENASGFGSREAPTAGATSWHDGIDFSAPGIYGKPIYAPAGGTVAQAGPAEGYGNWIIIDHDLNGEKVSTLYGHIEDGHVLVAPGDKVEAGQHIADVGNAGTSTGAHLHFGVYPGGWKSQAGVDPMPWLSKFKAQTGQPAQADTAAQPSPVANTTPADPGAVTAADWEALAEKESTNNWAINSGNGFSGGVQFTASTWAANGGTEYAPEAWQASKPEQMEVANRVLKTQGWGAWPPSATIPGLQDKKPAPEGTFIGASAPPGGTTDDSNTNAPRGPPTDLPKSDKGNESKLQADAQRGMRLIAQQFPAVESIGGFRPGSGDHGTGSAVDAMISGDYRAPQGVALGDDIAKFFIDHAAELNVKYVIWRQQIWQGGSWTEQSDRGSDNENHYNHVHISFNQSGPPTATVTGIANSAGADPATAPATTPDGAQPYTPKGDQKEQELTPEQQANIKGLISAAKRSGIQPEARAAVLVLAYAGTQSNFISKEPTDDDPRIGIFAQTPLEGTDSENVSNLINVPYAADSFFARLKVVAAENSKWATEPLADVLTAMYPEQRTIADRFPSWEQLAINAVTALWEDPLAQANSIMSAVSGGIECAQGAIGGRALKAGSVPERFVKWITLGGQVCEGITAPLLAAQIRAESGFDESATSPDGAMGSSQFMPGTWQTWGKKVDDAGRQSGPGGGGNPRNVADATIAQAHMMCTDYETMRKGVESGRLTGDPVALTIAAYNAGAGAVFNAGGMPSGGDYTTQTQPYVEKILGWAKEMDGGAGELKPSPGGGGAGNSKIVEYATKMVGQDYVWGGGNQNGPTGGGIDCSGLTVYAYAQATDQRVILPRTTYDQIKVGRQVSIEEAQPGDLVLSNFGGTSQPEHVDIYEGNGTVIGAIQTGSPLKGGKPMPADAHIRHVPEASD